MKTGEISMAPEELHLWLWESENPVAAARAWDILSAQERERATRYRQEVHRIRFLCARLGLRTILASYLGCTPNEVCFSTVGVGKPALMPTAADFALRFNLAHSGRLAVLAIRVDEEVGVDIEQLRPLPTASALAERFFARAEARSVYLRPDAEREGLFFRLWTCKEAVLKGLGLGLTFPLNQVEVPWLTGDELPTPEPIFPVDRHRVSTSGIRQLRLNLGTGSALAEARVLSDTWWVWEFQPCDGFFGAVASSGPWSSTLVRRWMVGD